MSRHILVFGNGYPLTMPSAVPVKHGRCSVDPREEGTGAAITARALDKRVPAEAMGGLSGQERFKPPLKNEEPAIRRALLVINLKGM